MYASSAPASFLSGRFPSHLVILSSIERGSRMKVGRVTRLRSAPGRSWLMMCERTGFPSSLVSHISVTGLVVETSHTISLVGINDRLVIGGSVGAVKIRGSSTTGT